MIGLGPQVASWRGLEPGRSRALGGGGGGWEREDRGQGGGGERGQGSRAGMACELREG